MANSAIRYPGLIGQVDTVARLKSFTDFFRAAGTTPGHILLVGEDGMGQTTIASTIANELDVGFQQADASTFEAMGDLAAVLTNLRKNQVLMLANLNRLRRMLLERLGEALRDGKCQITIGQGPAARTHVMDIPPFTLIARCRRKSDCPAELLPHFSLAVNLQPYTLLDLQRIAESIGAEIGISLDPKAAEIIARCSGGTPRNLETTLLRLLRSTGKSVLSEEDVLQAFAAFGMHVGPEGATDGATLIADLSPQDFERMIATLLTRMGFHAETTRASGDGGIDVIAVLEKPIIGGRYLFQCKRFASDNLVGAPTIRDFYGAVTADRAVKGIFITTSDFTPQAREFAEKTNIELVDLTQLSKLLTDVGLPDIAHA